MKGKAHMNYRISKLVLQVSCGAAVLLVLFASVTEILWIWILGTALLVGGVVQALIFCKCPYCGAQFNTRGPLPKFCPECGKKLDD